MFTALPADQPAAPGRPTLLPRRQPPAAKTDFATAMRTASDRLAKIPAPAPRASAPTPAPRVAAQGPAPIERSTRTTASAASPRHTSGADLVRTARSWLGREYVWGGHNPATGMDCTGFTWNVARVNGIETPLHDLAGQKAAGRSVDKRQLAAGDLVFFENTYQPGLSHVGIFSGNGRFIHAADQSRGVIESRMDDPYWRERYSGATRLTGSAQSSATNAATSPARSVARSP